MPWTIDNALDDDLVTVVSRDDSSGFYEVKIGELETVVRIKLGRHLDSEQTDFQLSHAIHAPGQEGPYRTSIPSGGYPAYALRRAISGLTSHYKDAVRNGHKPRETWLVDY
jgi:hypothetical protein